MVATEVAGGHRDEFAQSQGERKAIMICAVFPLCGVGLVTALALHGTTVFPLHRTPR